MPTRSGSPIWRLGHGAAEGRRGVPALGGLDQRGDQFAAEGGDVGDDAAPDEVAVAEGGLVGPGRPGVDQVVLDAEGTGGARAPDDPRGDGDEAAVADDADRL